MSEIPSNGGSAFWAARGVRIEPEPVEEDIEGEEDGFVADAEPEAGAGDGDGGDVGVGGVEFGGIRSPATGGSIGRQAAATPDVPPAVTPTDVTPTDLPAVLPAVAIVPAPASEPEIEDEPQAGAPVTRQAPVTPEAAPDTPAQSEPQDEVQPILPAEPAPSALAQSESEPEDTPEDVAEAAPPRPAELPAASPLLTEPTPAPGLAPDLAIPATSDTSSSAAPSPSPFIPTQSTFDEVEPQLGEPVDGLVALNENLIGAARAKAERDAKAAEPVWQLTDDNLAALPDLRTCLEAILLVVDEPVTEVILAQIVERPTEQVAAALRALSAEYTIQGRGFDLREVGIGDGSLVTQTGWRFYTRAECAPVVERYIRDGQQSKLTQAALETLAVVAYRQPVSRSKVSAIRGVNCDGVMRTLLARGLVEECGTEYETGALLYRTTGYFLERMGLKGLEELPDLAPLLPSAADMEDEV